MTSAIGGSGRFVVLPLLRRKVAAGPESHQREQWASHCSVSLLHRRKALVGDVGFTWHPSVGRRGFAFALEEQRTCKEATGKTCT